jgi:hypothetical protein
MGIVLMIVALLCVLPLAGCAHGSSATIMDSIARIAEANAIYGKKTDVNVQVHTPVANVSIVVETEFRDESETTPVE